MDDLGNKLTQKLVTLTSDFDFLFVTLGFVFFATIVCARWLRRLAGVHASPPAFVLFNILFLWGVYIFVIRQGNPSLNHRYIANN